MFLANWAVWHLLGGLFEQSPTYLAYVIGEAVGIVIFAAFIFPVARTLVRPKLPIGQSLWVQWIIVSVAEAAALRLTILAISVGLILIADGFLAEYLGLWREHVLEMLLSTLFIGFFVWKVALVCGDRRTTFAEVHRFVWRKRLDLVGVYLALLCIEGAFIGALASNAAAMDEWAVTLAYMAIASFLTWLFSLYIVALYIEFARTEDRIESVFA